MSFEDFPDFGKIGKRLGKRLRDILYPPVHHGPSKEERLAQRLRDSLKGLVYFDNFEEIKQWTINDIDPVQKANTPLLHRSASQVYREDKPASRVLLCHDYSGGYHAWEGVRAVPVQEKAYSCHYLQYVEIFVYFSHKLVCIPPATWINTCHRNGVKVLGTFMLEGDADAKSLEKMFDQVDGEYLVARCLASMAQAYGFDGWLLNIEIEFPYSVQHPISNLTAFIRNLKRLLGANGAVIWYDAITKDNNVDYQNALTSKNVDFALAADAIFTNYKWTERNLHKTAMVAEQHGIKSMEVYFGVDVWAQNTNMPGPPRMTYPPDGGGGTLTGLAAHVLAQEGFSTAIFGPGWPFEHFSSSEPHNTSDSTIIRSVASVSEAVAVERAMWEGTPLPEDLLCNCKNGHPHQRSGYRDMPITGAAREYPVGSSSFLETDFQQAFRPPFFDDGPNHLGKPSWIPNLGSQALFPQLWQQKASSGAALVADLQYDGAAFLRLSVDKPVSASLSFTSAEDDDSPRLVRLRLFKTDLATEHDLEVTIDLNLLFDVSAMPGLSPRFYTKSIQHNSNQPEIADYPLSHSSASQRQKKVFPLDKAKRNARVVEVGICCNVAHELEISIALMNLYGLVIKAKTLSEDTFSLAELELYHRQSGETSEQRLRWTWHGSKKRWPDNLPWSDTTGPFSVFTIMANGAMLGEAHCLEFPLRPSDWSQGETDIVNFSIQGHLFGGAVVSTSLSARQPEREISL